VNALSDHVVLAKWKADVELMLMPPPLLSEFQTTARPQVVRLVDCRTKRSRIKNTQRGPGRTTGKHCGGQGYGKEPDT
jgi:hypothetical protein